MYRNHHTVHYVAQKFVLFYVNWIKLWGGYRSPSFNTVV